MKNIIKSLILITLVSSISNSQELTLDGDGLNLARRLGETIGSQLHYDTAEDIISGMNDSLDSVRDLRLKIDNREEVSTEEVREVFLNAAQNFEEIAMRAPEIMSRRAELYADFDTLSTAVGYNVDELEQRRTNIENILKDKEETLSSLSGSELEKAKIDIDGLSGRIQVINAALNGYAWLEETYSNMQPEFLNQTAEMDVFFSCA